MTHGNGPNAVPKWGVGAQQHKKGGPKLAFGAPKGGSDLSEPRSLIPGIPRQSGEAGTQPSNQTVQLIGREEKERLRIAAEHAQLFRYSFTSRFINRCCGLRSSTK